MSGAGDDDDYHTAELSRRSIQISDLKEDLSDGHQRILDAEERNATLRRNLGKLKVEIAVRKVKAQEMEDQIALDEATCEESSRALVEDAAAGEAELEQLRADFASLGRSLEKSRSEAEQARLAARDAEAEVGAAKVCLEAQRREVARMQGELAQEQAAEEARQAAREAEIQQQGASRLAAATAAAAAAAEEAEAQQAQRAQLESDLAAEQKSTEELQKSLVIAEEQHSRAQARCAALQQHLQALGGAREESNKLAEALMTSTQRQQQLSQDASNAKRDAILKKQSLEGALDETRRILKDHISETQRHTVNIHDTPIVALVASLAEAKETAEMARVRRQRLEQEADSVQVELEEVTGVVEREQAALAESEKCDGLTKELEAARGDLDDARRRVQEQQQVLQRSDASVEDAARAARLAEQVLRGKLEELWLQIKQLKDTSDLGPFADMVGKHSLLGTSTGLTA
eukprot:TRINITY_DN29809_c0_g1_i1.p1 TRINITY_DN29809_c0_g1~~TRINITY_DN29809_c0_g1_i1.p1  ORF type:complete len:462 (-),score=155.72 TRINITY_DN29809_c0_g1_i1:193-1578(-)